MKPIRQQHWLQCTMTNCLRPRRLSIMIFRSKTRPMPFFQLKAIWMILKLNTHLHISWNYWAGAGHKSFDSQIYFRNSWRIGILFSYTNSSMMGNHVTTNPLIRVLCKQTCAYLRLYICVMISPKYSSIRIWYLQDSFKKFQTKNALCSAMVWIWDWLYLKTFSKELGLIRELF